MLGSVFAGQIDDSINFTVRLGSTKWQQIYHTHLVLQVKKNFSLQYPAGEVTRALQNYILMLGTRYLNAQWHVYIV